MASTSSIVRVFLICYLAVIIIFVVFLPSHSEAAVLLLPKENVTKDITDAEHADLSNDVVDMFLLEGKPEGDAERRNLILKEINETALSLEDLEYLLQVVRAKHANIRERRTGNQQRCTFWVSTPTVVTGYCYYDFGNFVMCKAGDKLSFDARECPPRRRPTS